MRKTYKDSLLEHEYQLLRLDEEYLKKALKCALLLPPPGDKEVQKIAISHLLALEELGIVSDVLEQYRRLLDEINSWTLTFGQELCPSSHCADTYGDGVREMKGAVRRMLQKVKKAG